MARLRGPVWQLTLWRLRELRREPEAIFWVFAFPVLLALGLGIAFNNSGPQITRVVVEAGSGAEGLAAELNAASRISAEVGDSVSAHNALRTGRVPLVVVPVEPIEFRYDSTREESLLARLIVEDEVQRRAGRVDAVEVREVRITEPGARYIDFLIPGLLGMNIMGTGMWGIGFSVVQTRTRKLLKRFLASPMRRSHFLIGHMLARMIFLPVEVGAVLIFGMLAFGVPMRGSLVSLAVVTLAGACAFAGLGLLVAARVRTIEAVSGLMNVVMVPMWILSGVFFSASNFPDALQPFIQALPLTALNNGLRGIMLDGTSLLTLGPPLVTMGLWAAGTFLLALKLFRWS